MNAVHIIPRHEGRPLASGRRFHRIAHTVRLAGADV